MRLELFQSFWGEQRPWEQAVPQARALGYEGIEARIPTDRAEALSKALALGDTPFIGIALTRGGVIPDQGASLEDHLNDLEHLLGNAALMNPRFVNVLGGNDRWLARMQAEFINRACEIAARFGILCVFETHRARILASPWMTLDVLPLCPDALFTADISHWVVVCERLLNTQHDDLTPFLSRVHHIQARIGYDQGPQVPHPAAPEYAENLAFHQSIWAQIWEHQRARGQTVTTMTPEFGPDGYTHTLPFTNMPIADLTALNLWMAAEERRHFARFRARFPEGSTV